ncbi:MAG TPA: CHAT domain-containing tetratricopeptide repeat protein [Stellaceae bacterium]
MPGALGALSSTVLGAIVAIALFGCQGPPPNVYASGGPGSAAAESIPVGDNQVGEPCSYRIVAASEFGVGAVRAAALYCGNWHQPSGRIFELSGAADRGAAQTGPWRRYLGPRFSCGAPTETQLQGNAPALLMQCTRRYGGWPQVALTTTIGGRVFAADAVPSALPALEAALGALGGQPNAVAGRPPSEAARLIARRSTGRPFGSGDLERYYDLMGAGDAYNNIDDPADAEQSFREALAIQQRILGSDDPGLALTMMKLAAQISHQRAAPEADRLLADAADLTARANDPLIIAQLDYYRAVTAAYEGKPREADGWAQTAEAAFARLLPPGIGERPRPDRGEEALRANGIDVPVLTGDGARPPTEETAILGLAETLRLRAGLAEKAGDREASTALALRADRLLTATGLAITSTGARSLRLVASNEAGAADYSTAGSYGTDAAQVFERVVPGERPQALNMLHQGDYLLQRGRADAALALFRKAGEILRRPGVVGVPPEAIWPWLEALRMTAERQPANRTALAAEMFAAAQLGIASRTALDIAQATARLAAADPKAEAAVRDYQDKERDFDVLQAERDVAVANQARSERIVEIDKRIAAAQRGRDDAEAAVLAAAPRYAEWSEKPAALSDVRARIEPDEAMIFFFVSGRGSYGFAVGRGGILAYSIPLTGADIGTAVTALRDSAVERSGGLPNFDLATAYRLYAALLGPAEPDLAGISQLTIAANGDLLRFPLAALVTRPGVTAANGDYRNVPWLVRRFALSYFPSPRVFVNLRGQQAVASGSRPFIGFGDFVPPTAAQLARTFPPDRCHDDFEALRRLERLPDTRTEVVTIGRRLGAGPGDMVLGAGFTKARLMGADLARYRIVLLATHALLPSDLKCQAEPSILVSVPPRSPSADPGFLHTSDIDRLRLDADLVVLSACSTAGPDARTGESLSGLARAFFRGGAHGLLVTHWTIVSGAAIPLMIGTFPGGGGVGTAQALRRAQLQMIDSAGTANKPIELSYPNYWAAFALIGDGVRARTPGA